MGAIALSQSSICSRCLRHLTKANPYQSQWLHLSYPKHASTAAAATTPAPPIDQTVFSTPPLTRYPPTQPPSHRPPEFRKSQLHRQYTSLLRSAPLILLFQHNNLKATELMAIRRELAIALQKLDQDDPSPSSPSKGVKLQIIQSRIFSAALRIVEYWNPSTSQPLISHSQDPSTQSSIPGIPNTTPSPTDPALTHSLSRRARNAVISKKYTHPLSPLLSGPLALLTFPTVSPAHLKTAVSILSPRAPGFPAPLRRTNPGYHDPVTQAGLQKMLLLGARVEGRVFDIEGVRWVGGIEGGLEGMRGQLVGMLQGFGAGLTGALEGASRSLYLTVEGRRIMLEDEGKGGGDMKEGSSG
ncbi:MAG: hypothetical protein L6R42_002433 [Xanthoria sp. 1 TBL-2021]|nr:MAG: hypothetical protein L6R42_002433 [Xanthoria sp. 1 TBL-2021]